MRGAIVLVMAFAGAAPWGWQKEVVKTDRPLLPAEIAIVLASAREAVAFRTVRLSFAPDGPGPDIVFGPGGSRRMLRTTSGTTGGIVNSDGSRATWQTMVETIVDYTGRPARTCDGTEGRGQLVVEYTNTNGAGWKARARSETDHEIAAPILDMLSGALTVESGELRTFGDRRARAIVAAWPGSSGAPMRERVTGDPLPNVAGPPESPRGSQTLWIDVETHLPIRWTVSVPGAPPYSLIFTYDTSPEPRIPDGLAAPDCVP